MNQEKLAELIKRYRSGTATPEEVALLDKIWSDAEARSTVETNHTKEELEDVELEMFSAIKSEIQRQESFTRKPLWHRPLLYKVAASLLLLLMAASLLWYRSSNGVLEIRTDFGEQLTVTLPDQSKVVLNRNSVLRYTPNWDENSTREVWIEGEGFFSVIHTKNHQKFVVHGVSQLNVEVVGTKFNIKTRQSDSEVMLTEGKVKLELGGVDSARALFLKPGELATVKNKRLTTQTVDKARYTSWVENKLFFERTPLRDLSILLRDTYGLTVTFTDPALETRELSGEISATTADEILYAIGETLDLNVERDGQLVTISAKNN
ncbi:MAG TPA: FecR domain-containing protein [Cyclobacteriaceae bacterium]|nr:FecR domain-containing protein [Cyclobacteriaceae bacterium]